MIRASDRRQAAPHEEHELCPQCLEGNTPADHFCAKCGGQLSGYAATGPSESLFAEGNCYRRAVEQPQRFVIMAGISLIFGIGVLTGIGMIAANTTETGLVRVAGAALAVLSFLMIAKTTRNYRNDRPFSRHRQGNCRNRRQQLKTFMKATTNHENPWREYLSPLKLTLLAVNALCFGGLLVFLIVAEPTVPAIVLTISTGVSFGALVVGAILASRRMAKTPE